MRSTKTSPFGARIHGFTGDMDEVVGEFARRPCIWDEQDKTQGKRTPSPAASSNALHRRAIAIEPEGDF